MTLVRRYKGAVLYRAKDGRLFIRLHYRGTFEVKPGNRIWTRFGYITIEA